MIHQILTNLQEMELQMHVMELQLFSGSATYEAFYLEPVLNKIQHAQDFIF